MKIELFSKMVKEKALSEPKKVLDALNIKHAKIIDDMESGNEKSLMKHLEEIQNIAMERKRKIIAKTHSEVQNRILIKKSELFHTLKDNLLEEIKLAVRSEQYEAYFKEKLATALGNFSNNDALVIGVHQNDAKYLPEGTSIETNNKVLGGFYIIRNGIEKYDFTLNSEVDSLDDYLGCILNALYEPTEEGCADEE